MSTHVKINATLGIKSKDGYYQQLKNSLDYLKISLPK